MAVVAYPVVWLLFLAAQPTYRNAIGEGAETYYWIEGTRLRFLGAGGRIYFRSYYDPPFEAQIAPRAIYSNLPFLLALLLATPGVAPRRRALLAAAGLLLLYLSHVAFLVVKTEVILIAAKYPDAGNPAFWHWLDDFFEVSGKTFFPVIIWLALTLPYLLGKIDRPAAKPDAKVGRNEPCPCGSGKKFKVCCGKA